MSDDKKPPTTVLALRPGIADQNKPPADGERATSACPAKLTKGLAEIVIEKIKKLNHPRAACMAAGITGREFDNWAREVKDGNAHPILIQFFDAMDRAHATGETDAVDDIVTNASPETKMKMLERARPQTWSKTENVVISGALDEMLDRLQAGLEPAEFDKVLRLLGA
jgi:hypothetical protein